MRAVLTRAVAAIGTRFLLSFALALSPLAAIAGDWQARGPANGGRFVATHPTVPGHAMIVSSNEDLYTFLTVDGGARWVGNPWTMPQPALPWMSGAIAWLGTYQGLLRTTDQGRSWYPVPTPATSPDVDIAGVNPSNPDEIVLVHSSTEGSSVLHSINGGATWSVDATSTPWMVAVVDWSTRRLYATSFPAGPLVHRAIDTPGAWQSSPGEYRLVAAAHGVVLALTESRALYRSTNNGATFVPVAQSLGSLDLGHIAFSTSTPRVYAVDAHNVLRSDDDGATWQAKAAPPNLDRLFAHAAIDATNPDVVYVVTAKGLISSTDGATTFRVLDHASGAPGPQRSIAVDAVDPARQWLVGAHLAPAEASFERSIDGGTTWTVLQTPGVLPKAASRQRANTLFGFSDSGAGFAVSTNGGAGWTTTLRGDEFGYFEFSALATGGTPSRVYAYGEGFKSPIDFAGRLYASVDDGQSFVEKVAPPGRVWTMAAPASSPAVLYAGGSPWFPGDPVLWRSSDGAASWQSLGTFAPKIPGWQFNTVYAIAVDPLDAARIYVGLALPDNLMRSDDGGTTWTRATSGLGAGAVTSIAIDPANPQVLYAAVYLSGVFRSTDRGTTWTALDAGLHDDAVRQVLLDPHHPGRLYAATNSGLYQLETGTGLPSGYRRAIEFHHAAFDHYFTSADLDEIAGLDAGVFQGWVRTAYGQRVAESTSTGNLPTCRFFSVGFGPVSTHFYTPYVHECEGLKSNPAWVYEKIAFGLALPDPPTHGCAPGTRPLYRMWNRNFGGAPNHRYTTSPIVLDGMIGRGWLFEGDLPTRVFACVPS